MQRIQRIKKTAHILWNLREDGEVYFLLVLPPSFGFIWIIFKIIKIPFYFSSSVSLIQGRNGFVLYKWVLYKWSHVLLKILRMTRFLNLFILKMSWSRRFVFDAWIYLKYLVNNNLQGNAIKIYNFTWLVWFLFFLTIMLI